MMSNPSAKVTNPAVCKRSGFALRCLVGALLFVFAAAPVLAQENRGLNNRQEALSSRYGRFEKLLLQMAEYLGRTDPDRAELLMRALSRSREERISTRMNGIVQLLADEDFDEALEGQEQLVGNLRQLLELLQSEDRRSELEEEAARIRKMLKDVNKLIGDQKIARATAARSGKPSDGLKSQQRVADKTKKVIDAAKEADEKKAADSQEGEPQDPSQQGKSGSESEKSESDSPPGDSKADSKESGESSKEAQEGSPKESQGQPSKSESGGQSKPGESKPGQPQDGEPQGNQEEQKSPGREQLEEAQQAMERALEELKKDQKEQSSAEQDKALSNLLDAKEKLEEKLKQLREEERELRLAKLEARFQKMLAMQLIINSGTTALAGTPEDKWLGRDFTRSRELGQLENDVGIEAAKALTILREEGTSVSFPLAVEDVREDVGIVARRLEEAKVGELTQEIQKDIVEALQEMVAALQKEMEKGDDKKQQGQQQQQQAPQDQQGDPVLVELLAELRMLRTLQKRINRRTKQVGRELKGDQAEDAELLQQLDRLAERQARIRQTAIDIARTRKEK
jgi:hypothetical protein